MTTEVTKLRVDLEANTTKFISAMRGAQKAGVVTATDLDKLLARANRSVANNARKAERGLAGVVNISNRGRFVIQNTANQLGDMAVQLEGGTDVARVAAQQLPQLFGGFAALNGVLGILAPLLGTVAAIGIPLAAMFFSVGNDSEEAGKKVKTFADKLNDAESALSRAEAALATASAGGLEDLGEIYGEVTEKVRNLADALADIEVRAATIKIDAVLDDALGASFQSEIQNVFGAVGAALVSPGTEQARDEVKQMQEAIRGLNAEIAVFTSTGQIVPPVLTEQAAEMQRELAALEGRFADIGTLADELVVSPETLATISEMQARLDAARQAGDFSGIADALSEIRNGLQEAGDEIEQSVIDGLAQAEDQARKFAKELGQANQSSADLKDSLENLGSGLEPAVAEAIRLSKWLEISLETARTLAALGPQGLPGPPTGGRGGDPRDFGGSFRDVQTAEAAQFMDNYRPPRTSRRGGGRSRRTDPDQSEAKRLFESTRTEAENYEAQLERINELHRKFPEIITEEVRDRAVGALEESANKLSNLAQNMERSFGSAFTSIVTGSDSAQDALSGLLSQLAQLLAQQAFAQLGDAGVFNGLLGALGLPSADGGGFTGNAPRSGGLDGKGGFLAMLHPQETVIDHTRGQGRSGGSINISIDARGAQVGVSEEIDRKLSERMPQIQRLAVAGVGQARLRGLPV